VRVGWLAWLIIGFALCWVWINDWLDELVGAVGFVVGGLVTFLLELPLAAGIGGVLLLMGFTLWLGREWSERARGKFDADAAWNNRDRHRRAPGPGPGGMQ
jgi:hypothetical protein